MGFYKANTISNDYLDFYVEWGPYTLPTPPPPPPKKKGRGRERKKDLSYFLFLNPCYKIWTFFALFKKLKSTTTSETWYHFENGCTVNAYFILGRVGLKWALCVQFTENFARQYKRCGWNAGMHWEMPYDTFWVWDKVYQPHSIL